MVDTPDPSQINPTAVRIYTSNTPENGPTLNVQIVGTPYTAMFSSPLFTVIPNTDETYSLPTQGA